MILFWTPADAWIAQSDVPWRPQGPKCDLPSAVRSWRCSSSRSKSSPTRLLRARTGDWLSADFDPLFFDYTAYLSWALGDSCLTGVNSDGGRSASNRTPRRSVIWAKQPGGEQREGVGHGCAPGGSPALCLKFDISILPKSPPSRLPLLDSSLRAMIIFDDRAHIIILKLKAIPPCQLLITFIILK